MFNAAAARVDGEIVLLLRVAERPREGAEPPASALTLELAGPHPALRPLPAGDRSRDLVGLCFLDVSSDPPKVVIAYLPRDLPGLDLSDPRTVRVRNPNGAPGAVSYIDYLSQMSHLRVARSTDGAHFRVDEGPSFAPATAFEEYGVEDPRATWLDGAWQITYVSVSRLGITTSRATTSDFRTFERQGMMFLPDHKDVVLFPEKIGGQYAALTRPMPQSFARIFGIWIAFSDDLNTWGAHAPLALPRWEMWDELRTGAGSVPIRTADGWLQLYHGVDRSSRYAMGGLLLDLADPCVVLARSPEPILAPEEPYERTGLFPETIFSCGHVALDDDRIRLYYGAADSVTAAADFSLKEIVQSLRAC